MRASREFRGVSRQSASGRFVDDGLELALAAPRTSAWFPCGVYTMDGCAIVVANEPMDTPQYQALTNATVPAWATAVVGATLLSGESGRAPRLEVEVVIPDSLSVAEAAFAAVCGSYDDAFHDANPVDGLVRVRENVLRVRAERETGSGEWVGTVEEATASERREMAHWRLYRSVNTRPGWGGWTQDGFRMSADSPYDVANMVHFGILPLEGLEIAVFQESLTHDQRARLAEAPRPPWIDVVALSHLLTPNDAPIARIGVDALEPPGIDRTPVAAAVAASYLLHGRFDVELEHCVVRVIDEEIRVTIEADTDINGLDWSVRTGPVR